MLRIARGLSLLAFKSGTTPSVYQGRKMSTEVVNRLEKRAKQTDDLILQLKREVSWFICYRYAIISCSWHFILEIVFVDKIFTRSRK